MIKQSDINEIKERLGDDFIYVERRGNTLWLVKKVDGLPQISQIRYYKDKIVEKTEAEGPDQVFCPLTALEMASEKNGEWRKKVLDYWSRKAKNKEMWAEIKSRFASLGEDESIKIYFHRGWNLDSAILECPAGGKVRHKGKLWKIKQRDSVRDWEVIKI